MFEKKIIHPVLEDGEEPPKKTEEELEAEDYVLNKVLVRPHITIFTALKWGLIFFTSIIRYEISAKKEESMLFLLSTLIGLFFYMFFGFIFFMIIPKFNPKFYCKWYCYYNGCT